MSEELQKSKEKDVILKKSINSDNDIGLNFVLDDNFDLEKNKERIFELADYMDKLKNFFLLRNKYTNLFNILPDRIIFSDKINEWSEWERVLLVIFTQYPSTTKRAHIWKHDIKKVNLRNIIKDKPEFIETLEDKILLTERGLKYILNKLETENSNLILQK